MQLGDEVIDSRDVIDRITELEDQGELDADEIEELAALKELAAEGEDYAEDWQYGETLILDSYFQDYARELAEDCGMVSDNAEWPTRCIDWKQAADELRQDYTSITVRGFTYWTR